MLFLISGVVVKVLRGNGACYYFSPSETRRKTTTMPTREDDPVVQIDNNRHRALQQDPLCLPLSPHFNILFSHLEAAKLFKNSICVKSKFLWNLTLQTLTPTSTGQTGRQA